MRTKWTVHSQSSLLILLFLFVAFISTPTTLAATLSPTLTPTTLAPVIATSAPTDESVSNKNDDQLLKKL
jgi:hypothetical protein